MLKPTIAINDPFAVALGFADVEAQFTYAAADTVLMLKWDSTGDEPRYEYVIVDTGLDTRRDDAPDEEAQAHAQGVMTIAQGAALMFLCIAADELNDGGQMGQTMLVMYDIVEKWLTEAKIPNNLRPIP